MIKYDGEKVKLGGKEWILPPLSLKNVKQLESTIARMAQPKPSVFDIFRRKTALSQQIRQVEAISKIIYTALKRNYPDLKYSEVEEMIEPKNMGDLMKAVIGVTGLESGEQKASQTGT